jgi:hypothetical protein
MPDLRMTIRRVLLIAAALMVAYFAVRAIRTALASDETRIRWLLADEAAAFNDCGMLSVLDHFAPEWQDETTGVSRQALKGGLLYVFQNRRDAKTGRFLYRIEVGETDIDVQGERATAKFPLVLHEGIDTAERAIWELKVTADLGKHDGSWRIDRSRHETVHGTAPR